MRVPVRVGSIVTLLLVAAYHVLRRVAGQCTGPSCDEYIIPSLVLPLLVLMAAAITGLFSVISAGRQARAASNPAAQRSARRWLGLVVISTLVSVLGPIASAAMWRDQPDLVVTVGTVLILVLPVTALLFGLLADRSPAHASAR